MKLLILWIVFLWVSYKFVALNIAHVEKPKKDLDDWKTKD